MTAEVALKSPCLKVAIHCPKCGKEATFDAPGLFQTISATVACQSCPYKKNRSVSWPRDAFYQVPVCNDVLWGWSREHFTSIRNFIASKNRNLSAHRGLVWAVHSRLPAHFLDAKRRETIVHAIDQVLKAT